MAAVPMRPPASMDPCTALPNTAGSLPPDSETMASMVASKTWPTSFSARSLPAVRALMSFTSTCFSLAATGMSPTRAARSV